MKKNGSSSKITGFVVIFALLVLFPFLLPFFNRLQNSYGLQVNIPLPQSRIKEILTRPPAAYIFVFFGYTTCSKACPVMTAGTLAKLPAEHRKYFISIDNNKDKLDNLERHYSGKVMFISGSDGEIRNFMKPFNGFFYKKEEEIIHTTNLYLLDKSGNVRYIYTTLNPDIAEIQKDIIKLEKENASYGN